MVNTPPRIALIHALIHSIAPINTAFDHMWPDATRINLLDDSLSADLARQGGLTETITHHFITQRFIALSDYAMGLDVDAILFTCSAFGPCIDQVAARHRAIPVRKPNEAMVAQSCAIGGRIGLIASFEPTLRSMPSEFPKDVDLVLECVPEALAALNAGDGEAHDRAVLRAAQRLCARGCNVVALAQFSMARAAPLLRQTLEVRVLTTVESAVEGLRALHRQDTFR